MFNKMPKEDEVSFYGFFTFYFFNREGVWQNGEESMNKVKEFNKTNRLVCLLLIKEWVYSFSSVGGIEHQIA